MGSLGRRTFLKLAAAAGLTSPSLLLEDLADPARPRGRLLALLGNAPLPPAPSDYPLRPVRFRDVRVTDSFWRPRMEANREVALRYCFDRFENDSGFSLSKLIEAAAYMLDERPDPALAAYVERRVDGLLATLDERVEAPEDSVRVSGHVLEAAAVYPEVTGNPDLLDAVVRLADQMDDVYGPGKETYISGHQGLKMGLVALCRATGDERYWRLAKFFADERGKEDYPRSSQAAAEREYAQDHAPVVEQREAVGHAVRATFQYIAMTDIAALTGDPAYDQAVHRIWEDQTYRKTYLTGGIGSVRYHEKYGEPYELPNFSAWHETCASYGNAVWNHRLALLNRDARYADLLERVLYNSILVGVSLSGDRFFYQNILKCFGDYRRFEWINVPCCPPNVVRMIASVGDYIYATEPETGGLYVNLFVDSDAQVEAGGQPVRVRQETRYPWEGNVRFRIDPEGGRGADFPLHIRMPGWTRNEVMPGDLYRFADVDAGRPVLRVNGEPVSAQPERGWAVVERMWRPGDVVELDLPIPVRKVHARPEVEDDRGRVALQRGPLVYAAEWPENDGRVHRIVVPEGAAFTSEFRPDLLEGVEVIRGRVEAITEDGGGGPAPTEPHELIAIPWYAWANRGMGEMAVWLAREPGKAWLPPSPPPPIARVETSGGVPRVWTGYNDMNDALSAIYDGREPLSSADASHRFFRMRPPVGERAWVVYEFEEPVRVSSSRVYFYDDKRFCRLPDSWRLLYRQDGEWTPVAPRGEYRVDPDRWAELEFEPVVADAVRLEVEPRTILYEAGSIGPPAAMFIEEDIQWRELGLIEWQVT